MAHHINGVMIMGTMTKTQAKRAIKAAQKKVHSVYFNYDGPMTLGGGGVVTTADLTAIDKLCNRILKRLG